VTQVGGYKETLRSFEDYQASRCAVQYWAALLAFFLLSLIGFPLPAASSASSTYCRVLQAGHVWLPSSA